MRENPRVPGLSDWRMIARGGFATVWEARQDSLNRQVAVKVDGRELGRGPERERFLRESAAAGRLSGHPGIVTVHDAGILPDDRPFLVMELCTGGSLVHHVEAAERPSQRWVRDVGVRIADALAAAHAAGVLHRDVKPANILLNRYGHAGLSDFGLATVTDPGMELGETLEALTPAYAPPEAFRPHSPTEAADVYSLAGTLYALLAGHPPRSPDNDRPDVKTALMRLNEPVTPVPGVEPTFMDALLVALSDDPAGRPSAAGFRDALAALTVPDQPPGAEVPGPPGDGATAVPDNDGAPTAPLRVGRWRGWVAALVAVAVVAGLVVGALVWGRRDPAAAPVAAPTPMPTTASAAGSANGSPSAAAVAAGFTDCSDEVGTDVWCRSEPQCWGGIQTLADSPTIATPAPCDKVHVYETFVSGPLTFEVRRQSQLEDDMKVKRTCRQRVVNRMLPARERRDDWEVFAIPPQTQDPDDTRFLCIFGRGERSKPLTLSVPD